MREVLEVTMFGFIADYPHVRQWATSDEHCRVMYHPVVLVFQPIVGILTPEKAVVVSYQFPQI
jgi:hypothetical protein